MIVLIVGTRPQIIKSAPLVHEFDRHGSIDLQIIHTGQHYDYNLSKIFFDEMQLPAPTAYLGVGSGSHIYQIAEIMLRLEDFLSKSLPELVIVPGDTNSALASALASVKLNIPVAHIEAGPRCYDMSLPEEVNRRIIDHISNLLFAPSKNCFSNLTQEKVMGKIFSYGNILYDAYLSQIDNAQKSGILDVLDLREGEYAVMTIHRAKNVDDEKRLSRIIRATMEGLDGYDLKAVFPAHPRTMTKLSNEKNMMLTEPVSHRDMLKLILEARLVLTDSGGVQQEAFWSKVPCITFRDRTEWIETVETGANVLASADTKRIKESIKLMLLEETEDRLRKAKNPYGDGRASQRILEKIINEFELNLPAKWQ